MTLRGKSAPMGKRPEEPLGVIPGYRVELARNEYLGKLELTGVGAGS